MHLVLRAVPPGGLLMAVLALAPPAALAHSPPVVITPDPAAPGTSTTFTVNCASLTVLSPATSATLIGTTLGLSEHIPMQAGPHSNEFVTTVVLPAGLQPGRYQPDIDCGNGLSASAALTVNPVPVVAPGTGDGATATTANGLLSGLGLGLLGGGLVVAAAAAAGRRLRRSRD